MAIKTLSRLSKRDMFQDGNVSQCSSIFLLKTPQFLDILFGHVGSKTKLVAFI